MAIALGGLIGMSVPWNAATHAARDPGILLLGGAHRSRLGPLGGRVQEEFAFLTEPGAGPCSVLWNSCSCNDLLLTQDPSGGPGCWIARLTVQVPYDGTWAQRGAVIGLANAPAIEGITISLAAADNGDPCLVLAPTRVRWIQHRTPLLPQPVTLDIRYRSAHGAGDPQVDLALSSVCGSVRLLAVERSNAASGGAFSGRIRLEVSPLEQSPDRGTLVLALVEHPDVREAVVLSPD